MRTTLEIDDDILAAAKELALRESKTAGKIISDLARRGIQVPRKRQGRRLVNGFEILPADDRVVTPQLVQKLLDEHGEA